MNRMFCGTSGQAAVRGFSLIELLITLTIIGLMIGVGVPMYGSFTQGSSVSGASSELIGALNESRSRAVSERRQVRLEPIGGDWSNGWQSVRVANTTNEDPDDDVDVVLFELERTDNGTVLITEANGEVDVVFDREGRSPAREFTIALGNPTSGSPGRVITVSPLGRVAVEKTTEP